MNLETFYEQTLGIYRPWMVVEVQTDTNQKRVQVTLSYDTAMPAPCPVCKRLCRYHDQRDPRTWRHLDTMDFQTILIAQIPRIDCPEHGVRSIQVPWGEPGSRFSLLFEASTIRLLKEVSESGAARLQNLKWDQVDNVMKRAVKRGLRRREKEPIEDMGIDEVSIKKGRHYATIIFDKIRSRVVEVLNGHDAAVLLNWLNSEKAWLSSIKSITMDMWDPFIAAIRGWTDLYLELISFDRFHVSQNFSKALDKIRAEEHRRLSSEGDSRLKHTRYDWLRNSGLIDNRGRREFIAKARSSLRTARAWAMKETASGLWDFRYRGSAEKAWKCLIRWMLKSRLEPMRRVAKMLKNYLWGILNAVMFRVSNAASESINALIQKIKFRACGFRNTERFRRAVLFHFGGLDMTPNPYGT